MTIAVVAVVRAVAVIVVVVVADVVDVGVGSAAVEVERGLEILRSLPQETPLFVEVEDSATL